MARLLVVTATTNPARAEACLASFGASTCIVTNGGTSQTPYLGTVGAFKTGVDLALTTDAEIIACLHDDLEIHEPDWQAKVLRVFDHYPAIGLVGFGGAKGLGSDALYQAPYDPMQLARVGFRSDLIDAEQHGVRSLLPERVACLDGFSQIGRRAFWEGRTAGERLTTSEAFHGAGVDKRPWHVLEELGFVHHFYDGALGCLAARAGWETWYVPVRATHYGGRTAVADTGYQAWAAGQIDGGDAGFWRQAHALGYDAFRDVLPLRV